MTDRPLLMSGPMVRATLAELKINTRRVLRLEGVKAVEHHGGSVWSFTPEVLDAPMKTKHPLYAVGDRLWVRETFYKTPAGPAFAADGDDHFGAGGKLKKWPAIHMPRTASRLTLIVTGVKVERLQDISEEDAIAEGMRPEDDEGWSTVLPWSVSAFRELWNNLNAKRAPWESNPWVVAIAFKAHKINIDSIKATEGEQHEKVPA